MKSAEEQALKTIEALTIKLEEIVNYYKTQLTQERERSLILVKALEAYCGHQTIPTWDKNFVQVVPFNDGGERARQALAEYKGDE
jgi:hypothetical protein